MITLDSWTLPQNRGPFPIHVSQQDFVSCLFLSFHDLISIISLYSHTAALKRRSKGWRAGVGANVYNGTFKVPECQKRPIVGIKEQKKSVINLRILRVMGDPRERIKCGPMSDVCIICCMRSQSIHPVTATLIGGSLKCLANKNSVSYA